MNIAIVVAMEVLITFFLCGHLTHAGSKLAGIGVAGSPARLPFFLVRLYIVPAILRTRDSPRWYVTGPLLGTVLVLPLALWSTVPGCPVAEKWLNLGSGSFQGLVLAYTACRLSHSAPR